MIRRWAIQGGWALLLAMAGAASAEPAPAEPSANAPSVAGPGHVVTNPDWAEKPTGESVARYYPERAQRHNVTGRAVLRCRVSAEGRADPCVATSEEPLGYGFGEAAIDLAQTFRFRPQTVDGRPVAGGVINIPIHFTLPPQTPAKPFRMADLRPALNLLAAVLGALLAIAGGVAILAGPRGTMPTSTVGEAPRARFWPMALFGIGLAIAAFEAPQLLHLSGRAGHAEARPGTRP